MPKPLWWIANRLLLLTVIGIVIILYKSIKARRFTNRVKFILFAILSNAIYISALIYYDWQYYQLTGHSLGFQARYLMPLLSTQMALILIGITQFGWNTNVKEFIRKVLILFFFCLQITAIYTVASSYYDISSLHTFIIQASQYKPWFAKGDWWYLWLSGYVVSVIYLTWTTLFTRDEIGENEKNNHNAPSRSYPDGIAKSRGRR